MVQPEVQGDRIALAFIISGRQEHADMLKLHRATGRKF
jgi:hypothetical protein